MANIRRNLVRQGADIKSKVDELEALNQSMRDRDRLKDDAIAHLSDQLVAFTATHLLLAGEGDRGAIFQEWNWRATFTDCTRQVFYVHEEICDSPSPESGAAHSLFVEWSLLSFSTTGVSYIFCAICYAILKKIYKVY